MKLYLWQQERGTGRSGLGVSGCKQEGKWELGTMEGLSGLRSIGKGGMREAKHWWRL